MYNKLASGTNVTKYAVYTGAVAVLGLVMGAQAALARTTPCGTFDASYGYYGQCDANNNPIGGVTNPVTQPTQPVVTNPVNTNTNTNTNTNNTNNNTGYNTGTCAYYVTMNGVETCGGYNTGGSNNGLPACGFVDPIRGTVVCDSTGYPVGYQVVDVPAHYVVSPQPTVNIYYGNQSQNNTATTGNNANNNYANGSNNSYNTGSNGYNMGSGYNTGTSGYNTGNGYNYGNSGYNTGGYVNSGYGYSNSATPAYLFGYILGTALSGGYSNNSYGGYDCGCTSNAGSYGS